jgi:4-hydroxy-tetrahydrodipicolinate synthase
MDANWNGVFTALVTPFHPDGSLDTDALRRLVEWQIRTGVAGLVPCGTTGESAALTPDEHQRVVATVVEAAAGRVPVIAGAGANCYAKSLELSQRCLEAGAKALLHVTPYYIKPTQRGLVDYYQALADAVQAPILIYNVPSRTGVTLAGSTILQLARHPLLVALKQASSDLDALSAILYDCPEQFAVLSGEDSLTLPMVALGAHGVISVASNVAPGPMCDLVAAAHQGDRRSALARQAQLFPLMRALFLESNPIPVKFALGQLGRIQNVLRMPLTCLAEEFQPQLVHALALAEVEPPGARLAVPLAPLPELQHA